MSSPARKRYYREALKYTRWRPERRVTVIHGDGPFVFGTGHGVTLTGNGSRLTLETWPGVPIRPPPVLVPVGPVTTSWDAT